MALVQAILYIENVRFDCNVKDESIVTKGYGVNPSAAQVSGCSHRLKSLLNITAKHVLPCCEVHFEIKVGIDGV